MKFEFVCLMGWRAKKATDQAAHVNTMEKGQSFFFENVEQGVLFLKSESVIEG